VFRRLFRWLVILAVVIALIWIFAPRLFNNAANSLISSINSTASQAQGLALFVPAGPNSPNRSQGDLQINLTGLNPNTTYALTLDQGQCGGVSKDLGQRKSDANGHLYIEIPLASLDITRTWFVNVLQQGQSVACGLLQTNQSSSTQAINATQSGPNVFGPQTGANQSAPGGLPNTGVKPGGNQQYRNNQYPRKY
jgi:hypothetical protein